MRTGAKGFGGMTSGACKQRMLLPEEREITYCYEPACMQLAVCMCSSEHQEVP